MTIWIWILLIASVAFGVTYTALGLKANAHLIEKASSSDRSVGWLFWCSFSKDKYNVKGKGCAPEARCLHSCCSPSTPLGISSF